MSVIEQHAAGAEMAVPPKIPSPANSASRGCDTKIPVSEDAVSRDLGNVREALDGRMLHFGTDLYFMGSIWRAIIMVDPEKQAAFVDALRKKADELAAKNPVFADIRSLGKALVDESRRRIANGEVHVPIGAYLMTGSVTLIDPEEKELQKAVAELFSKLKVLAREGKIQAAAICHLVEKEIPGGSVEQFLNVYAEHSTGKAVSSAIPADESVLIRGVPGTVGPGVFVFGDKMNSRIFLSENPSK